MLENGRNALRRAAMVVAVLTATALSLGATAPAALAQTGYPGSPTTTSPQPTSASIDLGLRALGTSFDVSQCNFLPGAVVTIVVNDTPISPNSVADANGCIIERFEIKANLVALGRLSVLHPLAATGLAANSNVQIAVNGQLMTIGPIGTVVTSVARGTGANTAARTVTVKFTVVKKSTVDNSGLARTGTTIVRWSPLGIGLLGLGYLLVLASRRRRANTAA